ncbi:MAG: TRASH domain-containing protein [Candidatus Bathyarchaeia archaeon]
MRCQVCGKIITGKPVTRKTCCVNKLYVFCSEACLRKWNQNWLKRQI